MLKYCHEKGYIFIKNLDSPPPPPHPSNLAFFCCLLLAIFSWGGGCHSVPYKTGGRSPKIFLVLRVSVWSKNKRGRAPSLDPPLIFKCERCCLQHLNIVFKGVGEGRLVSPWWSLETCTVGKIQPIFKIKDKVSPLIFFGDHWWLLVKNSCLGLN